MKNKLKDATRNVTCCPLCGEKKTSGIFENFDRLHGVPGLFRVARCSNCSSLYLLEVPRDLSTCYPEGDYYSTFESNPSELSAKKKLIKLFYSGHKKRGPLHYILYPLRTRVQGIPAFVPGGKALDVGCGFGLILDLLKSIGWQTHGIDVSASAIELVRKKGHTGVCGELHAGLYPAGYFDAVIMSHSIEHLSDPRSYLRIARETLKPQGQLIALAPNARSLGFRLFGRAWAPIETPRHLFVPSPEALKGLLCEAGFSVESMKYTGASWSQSLDYLYNGRHTPSSFFHRKAVGALLEAVAQVLNLSGLGDSFQINARKA